MYIKSTIPLTFNDGISGQKTSTVIGTVQGFTRNGDCTYFGAEYTYADFDDQTEEGFKKISSGAFELKTEAEIQALYDQIKDNLPSTDNEPLYERSKIYEAFRIEMVQTFLPLNPTLTVNDIEIVP
jgi:hypothetical protein